MLINKVTLSQLIAINAKTADLDAQHASIELDESISTERRHILLTGIFVKKARITYNYLSQPTTNRVNIITDWYSRFMQEFDIDLRGAWWESIGLCAPELTHTSPISFGQFIDAKMLTDAGIRDKIDRWKVVQYLIAIFMVGKEGYNDLYTDEDNDQFILAGLQTLDIAIKVSRWWDTLNTYINAHYTVFQDSGDSRDNSDNIDAHMKQWGWVNFLKSIAKTKAFDISGSGLNSIDCVRRTKASEILVWASEEKEYNVAQSRDMKLSAGH